MEIRIRHEDWSAKSSNHLCDVAVTGKETPDDMVKMVKGMGVLDTNSDGTYEEAYGQFVVDHDDAWFEVVFTSG